MYNSNQKKQYVELNLTKNVQKYITFRKTSNHSCEIQLFTWLYRRFIMFLIGKTQHNKYVKILPKLIFQFVIIPNIKISTGTGECTHKNKANSRFGKPGIQLGETRS